MNKNESQIQAIFGKELTTKALIIITLAVVLCTPMGAAKYSNPLETEGIQLYARKKHDGTVRQLGIGHGHHCPTGRKKQSGVDIPPAPPSAFYQIQLIVSSAYAQKRKFAIGNNGHTASLTMDNQDDFLIGGPMLNGFKYKLHNVHFHWSSGATGNHGNEHSVFGERNFPLEIHLVHYKVKFGNISDAIKSGEEDALTVIGVPCRAGNESDKFLPVTTSLQSITNTNDITHGNGLKVRDLFAHPRPTGFRMAQYLGSLTTPECNEVVLWNVLTDNCQVGKDQLDQFRKLKNADGAEMSNNIRDLQDLNGRTVSYFKVHVFPSKGVDFKVFQTPLHFQLVGSVLLLLSLT